MTSLEHVLYTRRRTSKTPGNGGTPAAVDADSLTLQQILLLACDIAAGVAHLHPCTVSGRCTHLMIRGRPCL